MFLFFRSETTSAVSELFLTLKRICLEWLEFIVEVKSVVMDHSQALATGVLTVYPECSILDCWAHLVRKLREVGRPKIVNSDKDATFRMITDSVHLLHSARSERMFQFMADLFLEDLRHAGEEPFANWFKDVYLAKGWEKFYAAAAGCLGASITNNPLESWNRHLKRRISRLMSMTHFLNNGIQTVVDTALERFRQPGVNICNQVHSICNQPIPTLMLQTTNRKVRGRMRQAMSLSAACNPDVYLTCISTIDST